MRSTVLSAVRSTVLVDLVTTGKCGHVNTVPVSSGTSALRSRRAADVLDAAISAPSDPGRRSALTTARPVDRRDRFETLLDIYELATGPLAEVGDAARLTGSPELSILKTRLEGDWLAELEAGCIVQLLQLCGHGLGNAGAAMAGVDAP